MRSRDLFLIAAVLLTPGLSQAQTAEARGEAQAQAQVASAEARIQAAFETALEARIPVTLLERKVREGEAKRVPSERIAAAVETRLQALVRASEAMERARVGARSEGELAVMADALEAEVREDVLIRIAQNAPAERRAVAIAVLADLVTLGYLPEPAYVRVSAAMANPTELANLRAEVAASVRARGGVGIGAGIGIDGRIRNN